MPAPLQQIPPVGFTPGATAPVQQIAGVAGETVPVGHSYAYSAPPFYCDTGQQQQGQPLFQQVLTLRYEIQKLLCS